MDWSQVLIRAVIGGVIAAAGKLSVEPVIIDWLTLVVTLGAAFVMGALNVLNQSWPAPVAGAKKQGFWARLRRAF